MQTIHKEQLQEFVHFSFTAREQNSSIVCTSSHAAWKTNIQNFCLSKIIHVMRKHTGGLGRALKSTCINHIKMTISGSTVEFT